MANEVEIVVTARNNAAAGLAAASAGVRTLSDRMRDARQRATQLAQAERDAVQEIQRLDRVVRFFGSAATEEMRDNLAAAQIRLNDIRNDMRDLDDETDQVATAMGQASMEAAMFSVYIRNCDREMERLNRQFNRLDNRLRRNIGGRIDRLGDSIRQIATTALTNGIETVSSGLQAAARNVTLFAAVAPAVAGVAVVVAGVIGDLTGIVSILPAAVLAGAASLAVFKLGLKGVSDAFKAGLSGDTKAFTEAMKGLTREAQDFVAGGLMVASAWKGVQRAVQSQLFAGLGATIRQVNSNLQPLAEKWLPQIASLFNKAARSVGDFLKEASTKAGLDGIMEGVSRHIEGVLNAIPYLLRAFLDIGSVGASMFGDLGGSIEGAAKRFAEWIRGLKESGELQAWADRAKEAFSTLKDIVGDVGRVISSVFTNGADEGQTFLENIEQQTEAWADFMESADGARLVDSLGTIGAAMGHLLGVIVFLSEVWLGWVAVAEGGIAFVRAGWEGLVQFIVASVGWILDAAVAAFGWIPGVGDRLRQSQREFETWRNSSTNSLSSVATNAMNTVESINQISGAVGRAQGSINQLHGKTVYIDVIERKTMTGTLGGSGGYRGLASGGVATGMKWVGERGPELVDFGARGGTVKNAGASREMTNQSSGGGGSVEVTGFVGAGAGRGIADLLNNMLRSGDLKWTTNANGRVKPA